jgi:hypothetical protein
MISTLKGTSKICSSFEDTGWRRGGRAYFSCAADETKETDADDAAGADIGASDALLCGHEGGGLRANAVMEHDVITRRSRRKRQLKR